MDKITQKLISQKETVLQEIASLQEVVCTHILCPACTELKAATDTKRDELYKKSSFIEELLSQ